MSQYKPTFLLKRVDPQKVIQAYNDGVYRSLTLPTSSSNKIIMETMIAPTITGVSKIFRDKHNAVVLLHSTNNDLIKKLPLYKPRCFWCMQDLSADITTHVPIPTYMTTLENIIYFETDAGGGGGGCCCSFECALSFVRNFNHHRYSNNIRGYANESKEMYLNILYKLCHPDKAPLRPAPDFRLLQTNGGTMTVDEFLHNKSHLVLMPDVIIKSTSQQYMVS